MVVDDLIDAQRAILENAPSKLGGLDHLDIFRAFVSARAPDVQVRWLIEGDSPRCSHFDPNGPEIVLAPPTSTGENELRRVAHDALHETLHVRYSGVEGDLYREVAEHLVDRAAAVQQVRNVLEDARIMLVAQTEEPSLAPDLDWYRKQELSDLRLDYTDATGDPMSTTGRRPILQLPYAAFGAAVTGRIPEEVHADVHAAVAKHAGAIDTAVKGTLADAGKAAAALVHEFPASG